MRTIRFIFPIDGECVNGRDAAGGGYRIRNPPQADLRQREIFRFLSHRDKNSRPIGG